MDAYRGDRWRNPLTTEGSRGVTTGANSRRWSLAGNKVHHLFLVEGHAEEGLVKVLLRNSTCPASQISIKCLEGINNLDLALRQLVSEPEWQMLHSVTIVLDADDDPQKRLEDVWQRLKTQLSCSTLEIAHAKQKGIILYRGTRYAVWLNPGPGQPGKIEDLVLKTVDPDCVAYIQRIWRKTSPRDCVGPPSAKALVAVWIACRANKGLGLGTAFERGLIDVGHDAFEPLTNLIRDQLAHKKS